MPTWERLRPVRGVHYNGFVSLVYEGKEDEMEAVPRGARFLRSFVSAEGSGRKREYVRLREACRLQPDRRGVEALKQIP